MSSMFGAESAQQKGSPARSGRSRTLLITASVLVVLFLSLSGFSSFWTERQWFDSVGYSGVFSTLLWTRIGLFLVFGGVMAAVVALNLVLAYRARPLLIKGGDANLSRYRDAVAPVSVWLLIGVSVLMGMFAGASASGQWREYSLWRHSSPFGRTDPYFDRDVGFYVFELPWWHFITDFVMALAVIGLLAAALVHYLYGGIRLSVPRDRLSGAAQVHLSVLLGVFVLAKAADYWLDRFDLVNGSGSLFTGMGYTDERAVLPAKEILTGIALICAVLFFLNVWRRTWLLPSMGIAMLALSAVLLGLVVPGVVQQFQVNPNEADKEGPYIAKNIEATREAYNLDDIEIEPYSSDPNTGAEGDLADLDAATSTVPLVDPKIVSQTFEQEQQVRAYYSVPPVLDVDRYEIDGTDRAVVLGVRELDLNGLAEADKNWSNLHTVYTHGNGVIAAYANQRQDDDDEQSGTIQWAEGQEDSESALTNLSEDGYESRVYFGETSPSYSIVGQRDGGSSVELDLPKGERDDENQTTTYDGDGGVPIDNIIDKLLFAVRFGEPNLVLSGRVHEDSKILYDRNPRRMLEKVAPWLTVDSQPYPAVIDGRIQWILDGYTVTDQFPLSQRESLEEMTEDSLTDPPGFQTLPTDEINYMRNAVKATVDAYDGTVNIYTWDEEDPILKVWSEVFPDVVKPKSDIPDSLMEHLRYPDDLFKVQRDQFARYHLTEPSDWYAGDNRWQVPTDPQDETTKQPPYRLFVDDTWALTSVYVPRDKNNLASFVSVNSDATSDDYGRISVLELPNERTAGPNQIANELQSDEDVREELLGFTQGGVDPIFGNLLTLPVGDGLMYVQPVYTQRSDDAEASFPILRFVLVSYGDEIGIGRTLREAIANVLGVSETDPTPTPEPEPEPGPGTENPDPEPTGSVDDQIRALLLEAEEKFAAADRAQGNGNSVGWARLMDEGRDLIVEAVALAAERD